MGTPSRHELQIFQANHQLQLPLETTLIPKDALPELLSSRLITVHGPLATQVFDGASSLQVCSMYKAPAPFTPDEKTFLLSIADDIRINAELYRAGFVYLERHYSTQALHAAAMAAWRTSRDVNRIAGEPRLSGERYWLCRRLATAFNDLLSAGIVTPDDDPRPYDTDKANAVLCLTWLLTDKRAEIHPLAAAFGQWGRTFDEVLALKGRALARAATLDGELYPEQRAQWMKLVHQAWDVVQEERKNPSVPGGQEQRAEAVPVERIQQLPILDEFKLTLIATAKYVLAHSEQFNAAAQIINAELAAKQEQTPAYWLHRMLVDLPEHPPALTGAVYEEWIRRLMLLATLASYPGDLSRFGACGRIPWDHQTAYASLGDDPNGLPVPLFGRAWILFISDGTLHAEMQDKAGEYLEHHYGEILEGRRQDVVERTPWHAPGVLRQLVDRLKFILDEIHANARKQEATGHAMPMSDGSPLQDTKAARSSSANAPTQRKSSATADNGGLGGDDEPEQAPALTKAERLTLCTLARFDASILASVREVGETMDPADVLSERTITSAIRKLVDFDLAERPEGDRQGARLTLKGRRLAAKIAD